MVKGFLGEEIRHCTLASLLELKPELDLDGLMVFRARGGSEASRAVRGRPAPELIVADEASMVDAASCQALQDLSASLGCGVLLVGDAAQLPPVGDGRMSELFLQGPATAVLTEVVRNGGAMLDLCTAVRTASHPAEVWPTSSRSDAAGSLVLHPHQGSWQAEAARAIFSPEWDRNPDSARVLCWSNRSCDWLGQQLRAHRHGAAAAPWRAGWWVRCCWHPNGWRRQVTPSGIHGPPPVRNS